MITGQTSLFFQGLCLRYKILPLLPLFFPLFVHGAEPLPLDRLQAAYAPYVNQNDPWDFPQKIMALRAGSYKYWRGSKDDFFLWAKTNCADWLADKTNFVTQHGDVHLGNLGSYVTDLHNADHSFGLVDFDDSLRAPIQLEALECLITLRELAADKDIELTPEQLGAADRMFLADYKAALASGRPAAELLQNDPWIKGLFVDAGKKKVYAKMLDKYVKNGHFVPFRREKNSPEQLKEILLHADQTAVPTREQIAAAFAEMIRTQPAMQKIMPVQSAAELFPQIKDVARRIRFGSAGSQGQTKIFVLVAASATTFDHDVIMYLKEEIPSAGERTGITPLDPRPTGQRLTEDAMALTHPHPDGFGWCEVGESRYWVSVHEPWSVDGDPDLVTLAKDVPHAARILAAAAGASHAALADRADLATLFTPDEAEKLSQRADAYVARLAREYKNFISDPRVTAIANEARETVEHYAKAASQH